MTDKTDPRLDVAMARVNDRHYLTTRLAADTLLARLDAADRAAGIVRVDTRDEALVERVAVALAKSYPWLDPHPLDVADAAITALAVLREDDQ